VTLWSLEERLNRADLNKVFKMAIEHRTYGAYHC